MIHNNLQIFIWLLVVGCWLLGIAPLSLPTAGRPAYRKRQWDYRGVKVCIQLHERKKDSTTPN